MLKVSYRRVGGLRFLKIGRLSFSWCITRNPVDAARRKEVYRASRERGRHNARLSCSLDAVVPAGL